MKEETLKSELEGKFRGNSPRMKSRTSSFADSAVNAFDSVAPSNYEATIKNISESATEFLNLASVNAKKAYGYISKHKYQTLGIIGAVGLAGVGYFWMTQGYASKLGSKVSKTKSLTKKR